MTDIDLPRLEPRPLTLVPEQVAVRGPDDAEDVDLGSRILLGGPVSIPITAADVQDDPALVSFLQAQAGTHRYYRVHLELTFEAADGEPPFEAAEVEMSLSTTRQGSAPPIAWSMAPRRLTTDAATTRTWRLGPELTFAEFTGSLGHVEGSTSRTSSAVYLEALRVLRSDPGWQFRRTADRELTGAHQLIAVVRGPHDASVHAAVAVTATVRTRRLFRFRSEPVTPIVLAAVL